ncbi:MAG: gephyrin-like molybdotransferase Glp [Pseudomonadota bacterium]
MPHDTSPGASPGASPDVSPGGRPPLLSVAEARARVLALIAATGTEEVALEAAHGRILAADVVATRAQPPFAASAMDGYAVRAAEAVAGATLAVAGEIAAGHGPDRPLPAGAAMRLFTGAPLPEGADTVLIQENARREGAHVTVIEPPAAGLYVRPAGGDFAPGGRIAAPCRLTPRHVALAAAMGAPRLTVARRPVVALVPTGDELVAPGATPRPDQIFASNNYGLAARIEAAGAIPRLCAIAPDTREGLLAAFEEASGADIVVTLGGASVGDHDLVARVFGEAGLELGFHRIAMRPGKPLMAGRIGARVTMLGLPGNPVSAMVCGELFLVPAIERAMGLPGDPPRRHRLPLAHPVEANGPREHYMRARLVEGTAVEVAVEVEVAGNQDSSLLSVLAGADVLVVRAPRAEALPAGATVEVIALP